MDYLGLGVIKLRLQTVKCPLVSDDDDYDRLKELVFQQHGEPHFQLMHWLVSRLLDKSLPESVSDLEGLADLAIEEQIISLNKKSLITESAPVDEYLKFLEYYLEVLEVEGELASSSGVTLQADVESEPRSLYESVAETIDAIASKFQLKPVCKSDTLSVSKSDSQLPMEDITKESPTNATKNSDQNEIVDVKLDVLRLREELVTSQNILDSLSDIPLVTEEQESQLCQLMHNLHEAGETFTKLYKEKACHLPKQKTAALSPLGEDSSDLEPFFDKLIQTMDNVEFLADFNATKSLQNHQSKMKKIKELDLCMHQVDLQSGVFQVMDNLTEALEVHMKILEEVKVNPIKECFFVD